MHVDGPSSATEPADTFVDGSAGERSLHHSAGQSTTQDGNADVESADATVAPEMLLLRSEVEELVREVRAQLQNLDPERITPALLVRKLNQSIAKRWTNQPIELLTELEGNLDGATFSDFTDPDVLQGLRMLTMYSLQLQAETLREPWQEALERLPGNRTLRDIRASLEDATMQDFLEPAKWKHVWQLASYGALLRTLDLFQK